MLCNQKTGLQALVQYQSPTSAQTAQQYLNGKTVYVGTDPILPLTLYIQYSHLEQLTIKHNSASARCDASPVNPTDSLSLSSDTCGVVLTRRDYTTPLPWGAQQFGGGYGGGYPPQGGYGAPPPHYGGYGGHGGHHGGAPGYGGHGGYGGGGEYSG